MKQARTPFSICARSCRYRSAQLVALLVLASAAAAQTPSATALRPAAEVLVTANESSLWLARIEGTQTTLYHRSPLNESRRIHKLNGRAVLLAAVEDDLLVLLEDNSIFRYRSTPQSPDRVLDPPGRERPLQLLGAGRNLYALVPAGLARLLERVGGTATAPSTSPFDPGSAALSVAACDGRRWSGVSPCPGIVEAGEPGPLQPRLCASQGSLLLLWAAPPQIHWVRLDLQSATWGNGGAVGVPGLNGFWITLVSGVPTLIVSADPLDEGVPATQSAAIPRGVAAYRLLPSGEELGWRRGELRAAPLPAGAKGFRVASAFGFNQHVGLLVHNEDGAAHLQFARFGVEPTEPNVALADSLSPQGDALPFEAPLQIVMLAAVLGVFTTLLLFRRASLTRPVELPVGYTLAFAVQRVVAWLIDFLPFMLLAAVLVNVSWTDGLRHISGWAVSASAESALPAAERMRIATWWAISAGGFAVYCLLMELIVGRTIGKLLLGVRILSETGQRPTALQMLIRNASRLVELLPPLWVLGFLALLTRNRQRIGDIFARTVVVRSAGGEKEGAPPRDPAARGERNDDE